MNTKSSLRLLHEALFTHTLGPELENVVSKHLPARENRPPEDTHPQKTRPAKAAPSLGWTASLILLVAPLHAREGIKAEALAESELVTLEDGFEARRDALLRQQIQKPFPPGDAGDLGAALSALFLQTDDTKANETLLHFSQKGFQQIRPLPERRQHGRNPLADRRITSRSKRERAR